MKFKLLLFFLCGAAVSAQAPFTTLSMEPTHVKRDNKKFVSFNIVDETANNSAATKAQLSSKIVQVTDATENIDFFENNSLAVSILNQGDARMSIKSQVIYYKINVFTPVDVNNANFRYNIPVMLIAKLSSTYDEMNASSSIDALDYEAAPITLRIMPSFKLTTNDKYSEKLLFGFYVDLRALNTFDPLSEEYSIESIGSGGIGFTFQGDGEAGFYDENGNYEPGKWIFSAMLQGATGGDNVIQKLFKTEKDFVTSFQSYFAFKIVDNSKFNLKIGYQHFFKESIGGNKNNFSIAVGL